MFYQKWYFVGFFLAIVAALCLSCSETGTGPDDEPGIHGVVKNADGDLLENVGIHLTFLNLYNAQSLHKTSGVSSVELVTFDVYISAGLVYLNWITASETQNAYFNVWRSDDGFNFVKITTDSIPGHGTTSETHQYSYIDSTLTSGTYHYRLEDVDSLGVSTFSEPLTVAENQETITQEYSLSQNFPNPFNPQTTIQFDIPSNKLVHLRIFTWPLRDTVRTLFDQNATAGRYSVTWDGKDDYGTNVTNGLYSYEFVTSDTTIEKVMCLNMLDPEHIRSVSCVPIRKTNSDGEFFISSCCLPIGEIVPQTEENGPDVVDELTISQIGVVALKEGYESQTMTVTMTKTQAKTVEFILNPQK